MALVDTFCITCIKTLNLNICLYILRVMYQLLNYGNIVDDNLVSMDVWANVAILLMYGSHDMRHKYSAG